MPAGDREHLTAWKALAGASASLPEPSVIIIYHYFLPKIQECGSVGSGSSSWPCVQQKHTGRGLLGMDHSESSGHISQRTLLQAQNLPFPSSITVAT